MFKELSRLFQSPLRIKILKYFTLQPNARVTAKEVAAIVGGGVAHVEAELRSLERAEVLTSKKNGKKTYALSPSFEHAEAIKIFLDSVTQPNDKTLQEAFRGIPGITLLVATGTLVSDSRPAVDLLVVSRRPKDVRIERAVKQVEIKASLPIRYAVFDIKEYEERRIARDRLLRDIFEFNHTVISGRA